MARDTQLQSDRFAADRQDSAIQSGARGAQALGQGLLSGAEQYRSGLAQAFQQQVAQQKLQLESAQVSANVAADEMRRQEASARLQHLQQSIMTGSAAQQLRAAKVAADMAEFQMAETKAKAEQRGEVPYSDRMFALLQENPVFEDPNSPTGFGRYERTAHGWKQAHATKEYVGQVQSRQRRRESLTMYRDAYQRESKIFERMSDNIAHGAPELEAQRAKVDAAREEQEAFVEGRAPQKRLPPPSGEPAAEALRKAQVLPAGIEKPLGMLKGHMGTPMPVHYDGLFDDRGQALTVGVDEAEGAPPELKRRADIARAFVSAMRGASEQQKKPLNMAGLKLGVQIILHGGDPVDFGR